MKIPLMLTDYAVLWAGVDSGADVVFLLNRIDGPSESVYIIQDLTSLASAVPEI